MRPAVILIVTYLLSVWNTGHAQVSCNLTLAATPIGTSCSSSCDGSVVLTPSGGTAPYSFNAFDHSFPGATVDTSIFDVINGNFSVSGGKLIAQSNPNVSNSYNNSIATKKLFADNGKLVVEGSFYIDYNTYTYFGLALNTVLSTRTQVPYSFFFSYGTLYISNEGQTFSLGSYSNSTWYDFKIEKLGTTVNYYMRNTGLSTYTLVGSKTSTLSNSEYKLAAMYRNNYSSYGGFSSTNWRVGGNPATSGLCPGTYTYTVFDAKGCFASATVTLGTNPSGFQLTGTATAASCSAASDGSVSLSPAGGTAPYSYGFTQAFQGGTINDNLFELRNGNFSQGSDLREGSNYNNNDSWDNTISTRRTFSDGGSLVFEASFKFDANADVLFGFTNTGVIDAYADMMIGFRVTNSTQVYAYTNKDGLVPVATISSGNWYDFKIEKSGSDVYYYTRLNGAASWTLQYTGTYTTTAVEYKAAALNYSNFYSSSGGYNTQGWNIASVPKTSNLTPGTYTYTITDANGCTATAVLSIGTGSANSVALSASVLNGACPGSNNGSIALNASGGTAPYSYSFNHSFAGTYIEPGLFETRNGMFSESGSLRGEVIPTSTFWDNSLATRYSFNGAAALSFEGSFRFDATANVYFGFVKDTAVINTPSLMQIGFYVNNGQLVLNAGSGDIAAGSVTPNTWYDFKLEKKGGLIWFYTRTTGSGAYNKLQVIPYSGSASSFRFATIMYGSGGTTGGFNSKDWVINDNPETNGLAAGNYNYRVFDATGCYAIASVQLPATTGFSATAVPVNSAAWNTCDGSVSITSSEPNVLVRRKAFTRSFAGTGFNGDRFEIRNGAFSQNNALIQNDQSLNTGWDNSICTKTTFADQGFLAMEMEMNFRSSSQVYFGFSVGGQMLSSTASMAYSYYYNAGILYAYTSEAGLVQLGSIPVNQWNGYRIEKENGSVRFYLRPSGDIGWQLVHTAVTASSGLQYCAGAINYFSTQGGNRGYSSRNWNVFTTAQFNALCPGQYTYKVLSGDCVSEVNFTIGTQLPLVQTMQSPPDVAVNTDPGAAFASAVSLGTPTFASTPTGITITNNAPLQFPAGITNVTWTAVDENGVTVTGVQKVTVTDAEPPVITAPANINITLFAGQTAATGVSTGTATATDNLPGVIVSADNTSTTFPVGNTIITWTATDAAGNTASATQMITVVASALPQITAPADVIVSTDPGKNYASNISIGTAVLSGNVSGVVVSNNASSQYPVGVNYVAWTVSDAFGHSATVYQKITVTDDEAPVVSAPANITVSTNTGVAVATGVQIGNANVSDNVGASLSNDAPAVFPLGVTTITWTAKDAAGNTGTAVQTVTVEDHEAPAILLPADVSVNTDPGLAYTLNVILGTAIANDNVAVVLLTNDAPAQYPVGQTLVTWIVTDAAGNSTTAIQKVTVTDAEPPSITAPADVNVSIGMSQQYATGVSLGVPVFSDNVTGVYASNNAPAQFPVGTTVVTWTVTDLAGNTATATQNVNVTVITEPPVVRCKSITVSLLNGVAVISAADIDNGSTAAAGIASMRVDRTVFGCNNIGSNTVVLTVTDNNGLSSSCTATVTVTGSVPVPVISSTPNSSVYTGGIATNLYLGYGAESTTLQVQAATSGSSYQWTGASLNSYQGASAVFTPAAAGSYPFAVTVTNASGCSASANINICVKDIRVPGSKNKKVYICHIPPGNHSNTQLLQVSINAVAAHLQHGDQLGSCNQLCGTAAKASVTDLLDAAFEVKVYPNPAATSFALAVQSANRDEKVTIRITDAFGRLVQVLNTVPGEVQKIGDRYTAGVYFAEVTQGTEKKIIRLLKQ